MSDLCLSVAIATCGRPLALSQCLDAIAAQTIRPNQIIVVDQHPLPETRASIDRSGLAVDYREQRKLGLSASRNLALSLAKGTVLAVTDDDCFPDPGWVAALLQAFRSASPPNAVTGPILPPVGEAPPAMYALSLRPSRDTRLFSSRTIPWAVGSGANFAAEVAILKRIGGWDERLGVGTPGMAAEDCEIIDRLLTAGGSIRYDGGAAIHHDWQTRERRKATRWSYGYGIGALCGLRLATRDVHAWRMLASYSRMHLFGIGMDVRRRQWSAAIERLTALSALVPGCVYGVRAARTPARSVQ
jgi:GT2 family glycosyltransferase